MKNHPWLVPCKKNKVDKPAKGEEGGLRKAGRVVWVGRTAGDVFGLGLKESVCCWGELSLEPRRTRPVEEKTEAKDLCDVSASIEGQDVEERDGGSPPWGEQRGAKESLSARVSFGQPGQNRARRAFLLLVPPFPPCR